MFPWARDRDEIMEPDRLWACFVGVAGEFPREGVAGAGRDVLMPGSRGALLEGEKGSLATVLCEGAEGNECGVAIEPIVGQAEAGCTRL